MPPNVRNSPSWHASTSGRQRVELRRASKACTRIRKLLGRVVMIIPLRAGVTIALVEVGGIRVVTLPRISVPRIRGGIPDLLIAALQDNDLAAVGIDAFFWPIDGESVESPGDDR